MTAHFGRGQVFMDIDHIAPGEDFVDAINQKVGACELAIVSIGPDWLSLTDASGKRRIDDSEDFVRMEIVAALERKIRVIPVLVGGARMPAKQDLPEILAPLARRNAIELSESRFHADVDRLIEAIENTARPVTGEKTSIRRDPTSPVVRENPVKRNTSRIVLVVTGVVLGLVGLIWFLAALGETGSGSDQSNTAVAEQSPAHSRAKISPPTDSAAELEEQGADENAQVITESANPNEEEWMPAIRERAEAGSATAQFELGSFYELGFTSIPENRETAMEWYRKAADQGHELAQEGFDDLSSDDSAATNDDKENRERRRAKRQAQSSRAVLEAMGKKVPEGME